MTDTPPPLQPHEPNMMQQLTAVEAKEKAQRTVGTFQYAGPWWPWMGPAR
jgi:hypothetical protein